MFHGINPRKIFLARHGESMANAQKRISGQLDTPLSEKGKQQAQWLCDILQGEPLTAIFTSTLQRAIDTARLTAEHHHLQIQAFDNLKEMHFGKSQGRHHGHVDYSSAGADADSTQQNADDNEDDSQFKARIKLVIDHLLTDTAGSVLIVGHRKTNEIILGSLLKQDLTGLLGKPVNIKNKYVYEIELGKKPAIQTIRLGGEFHGKKFRGIKDD
jgi:broad specificity phosphatase PhoE